MKILYLVFVFGIAPHQGFLVAKAPPKVTYKECIAKVQKMEKDFHARYPNLPAGGHCTYIDVEQGVKF